MHFWIVTAHNKLTLKEESVYVHSSLALKRLLEILKETHPEWERIKAKKTEKPSHIKRPWDE